jgi:hypothetical protein
MNLWLACKFEEVLNLHDFLHASLKVINSQLELRLALSFIEILGWCLGWCRLVLENHEIGDWSFGHPSHNVNGPHRYFWLYT